MFVEIFKDNSDVAQGQTGFVVYLHHRGRKDPRAVHGDGWRLPEPRETQQDRKAKCPINSGNWYKLCRRTIQSPFLFYCPPSLTHASD